MCMCVFGCGFVCRCVYKCFPVALTIPNAAGDTPLHCALHSVMDEALKLRILPQNDPVMLSDLLMMQNVKHMTPLALAVKTYRIDDQEAIMLHLINVEETVLFIKVDFSFTLLQSLIYHCSNNVHPSVIQLLEKKDGNDATVNDNLLLVTDTEDETALHLLLQVEITDSVHNNLSTCVPLLIDSMRRILLVKNCKSVRDNDAGELLMRDTPLHIALSQSIIELLIDEDKKVLMSRNSADTHGYAQYDTPLHLAIQNDYELDVIKLLVDDTSQVMLVKNYHENNPLHEIMSRPRQNVAAAVQMFLLGKGLKHADYLLHKGVEGATALHFAIEYSASFPVLQAIVNTDNRVLFFTNKDREENIHENMWLDNTPLHLALKEKKSMETVRLLIHRTQQLLQKTNFDRATSLHVALKNTHPFDTVVLLIPHTLPDVRLMRQSDNKTPLHDALANNIVEPEILEALVDRDRIVLRMCDAYAQTPLHVALQYGASNDTIRRLLQTTGPFPNILPEVDEKGNTPLHMALKYTRDSTIIKLLVDTDHQLNCHQQSPLHVAAKNDTLLPVLQWLLMKSATTHGASLHGAPVTPTTDEAVTAAINKTLTQVDYHCNTPLHRALRSRAPLDILKVLTGSEGKDFTVANEVGNTPLHVFNIMGHAGENFQVVVEHLIDKTRSRLHTPVHDTKTMRRHIRLMAH